jgi:hypothetical protein
MEFCMGPGVWREVAAVNPVGPSKELLPRVPWPWVLSFPGMLAGSCLLSQHWGSQRCLIERKGQASVLLE